jgi:hypothetical protein
MSAVTNWSYILGFVKTFDMGDGVVRYFVLLFVQLVLQPIFSLMEVAGVLSAIISPPVGSFHVVEKESGALKKRISSGKDISQSSNGTGQV